MRKAAKINKWRRDKPEGRPCYYCRQPMQSNSPIYAPTMEHRDPRSRGGQGGDNIVWACNRCNYFKGSMTEREFAEWLCAMLQFMPPAICGTSTSQLTTDIND